MIAKQRLKRERTPRERSPAREARKPKTSPPPPAVAEEGIHSGSEEGEIEED